jgi:hypothetical protein
MAANFVKYGKKITQQKVMFIYLSVLTAITSGFVELEV